MLYVATLDIVKEYSRVLITRLYTKFMLDGLSDE